MDRKWRLNRAAIHSVKSYDDFCSSVPPASAKYELSAPADLYAVYTVLHIEAKASELRWSETGGFYFFLASWTEMASTTAPKVEFFDDCGEIAPSPSRARAAMALQTGVEGLNQKLGVLDAEPSGDEESKGMPKEGESDNAHHGPTDASSCDASASSSPTADEACEATKQEQVVTRTQIIVPVSSSSKHLTPALLQSFFSIRGVTAQQLLLALVDGNGVVSRTCLYNYIQAPLEGPGTADLDLLDD